MVAVCLSTSICEAQVIYRTQPHPTALLFSPTALKFNVVLYKILFPSPYQATAEALGHRREEISVGSTIIEKILARASGREIVRPGDIAVCQPDMVVQLYLLLTIEGF